MYIALKKQWYELFSRGEKSIEWRKADGIYRRLRANDVIKLGLGYTGRHHLMRVWYVRTVLREDAPEEVGAIYPNTLEFLAIHCRPIALDVPRSATGPEYAKTAQGRPPKTSADSPATLRGLAAV